MCFSLTTSEKTNQDSIVSITSEQLKYTNLIFVEHNKLLKENKLLDEQIQNYKDKVLLLEQTDSLRLSQINQYENINKAYSVQLNDLNNIIRSKNSIIKKWQIGGITISAGLLLLLLLK
jgi:hypothetical protein